MRTTGRVVLGAVAAVLALSGSALAANGDGKPIRDELSTGSGYAADVEARCDIRTLAAERAGSSLQVTVGLRKAAGEYVNLYLHVNTKGSGRSEPEFVVNSEGSVGPPNRSPTGQGSVSKAQGGRQIVFQVPLRAIGSPRRIGVQAKTCGEGAVDIAPGRHYFGDRSWDGTIDYSYLTPGVAERVIEGRVDLACAASRRQCRNLPVEGVEVTAVGGSPRRTFTGMTDARGRVSLGVKKGVYQVKADSDALRIKTRAQSVDVRQRRSGRAAFEACGLKGRASIAAVTGGVWKGGNEDCLNYFELSWRPSSQALSITWVSMPVCSGAGGKWVGPVKQLLHQRMVDPRMTGTNLVVSQAAVAFMYPINSVHSGNYVSGSLSDPRGRVTGKYVEGLCTFGISNLAVKK